MERRKEGSERGEVNRQVSARNEARAAEIVNLEAERQRRVRQENARLRRQAWWNELSRSLREKAALGAESRRQREQDAQQQAARARIEAMTAQELAHEIAQLRPESPEKLALQSPETAQAQERVRLLAEERQAVEARRQQAEAGISAYRKRYRLRASLHDMGLMKSRDLTKHAQTIAETQWEEARLDPLASAALSEFATLKDQASARIAKEQGPIMGRVAELEQVLTRKELEDAQAAAREAQARKEAEERLAAERAAKEREEAQKRAEQEEREFWKLAKANPEAAQIEAIKKINLEGAEGDTARRRWRALNAPEREQEAPRPKTPPKEPPASDREAQRAERERQENAERIRHWNEKRARDRARGLDRDR